MQLGERHRLVGHLAPVVGLHRSVQRAPVDHLVRDRRWNPDQVAEPVLGRALEVVADLAVAQRQRPVAEARRGGGSGPAGRVLVACQAFSDGGSQRLHRGRRRQVERLEQELAHAPGRAAAVVARPAEDELLLGAGHAHVEEATLLSEVVIPFGKGFAHQLGRERQQVTAGAGREAIVDEARHDDGWELEALGPMVGQHVHRVAVIGRHIGG